MELPHIGKHCSLKSCSKLDFLPFECDACKQIFCDEHYIYKEHNCAQSYTKNVLVPQCPLCDCPIPVKRGEDPNIKVNEHISKECEIPKKKKMYDKRCSFAGCKKKELVPMTCNRCRLNFCIQHRLEMDHKCQGPATKYNSVFGGTQQQAAEKKKRQTSVTRQQPRQPQSTYLAQSGAELNRMRQARLAALQNSQPTRHVHPAAMSEDEAVALAIAQSLDQQPKLSPSSSSGQGKAGGSPSKVPPTPADYSEDEALALAIAASLQDQESPPSKKKPMVHVLA